ncbi:MAG: hypothetical protein AB7D37_10865 [Desulfovibrio sp.]
MATYDPNTTYTAGESCFVDHAIYTSLADGNIGNSPPTDISATTPHWSKKGYTNKWAAFDPYLNTAAVSGSDITYTLKGNNCNGIAFFNVLARQITVTLKNSSGAVVFTQTKMMTVTNINSWSSYFFARRVRSTSAWFEFPLLLRSTLEITISGSSPRVGKVIPGVVRTIGTTKRGLEISKTDYSVISTSAFGSVFLAKGLRAKDFSGDIYVPASEIIAVEALTDEIASIITAFYCANYDMSNSLHNYTLICGYMKSFKNLIEYDSVCTCTAEIQGVV